MNVRQFPKAGLLLATNNRHKVKEIRLILRRAGVRIAIHTLSEFPRLKKVIEDRPTIEGNAVKKATETARQTGFLALSDDTGLFIDALNGRPGVVSARFAGPQCNFIDNNRKVLRLLRLVPRSRRGADFRCVAALASPSGRVWIANGSIRGMIFEKMAGRSGFGYDPIFYIPAYKKTFAQMSVRLKNRISHRGQAFRKVPVLLKRALRTGTI